MVEPSDAGFNPVEGQRPTLKTIAEATNLAVATVSRALNDAPDIGADTKRRVREAAVRLGYRPNRAGVRLRTGRTNVIALLLTAQTDMMNHTAQLIYAISAALRGTPYHMIVLPLFDDEDPLDPVRYVVESESADAIIINKIRPDDPRIRYMVEHDFPFATHGRSDMGFVHPYYDFDNGRFAELALDALVGRGRRRIALLAPPVEQSYAQHMIAGAMSAADRAGAQIHVVREVHSDQPGGMIESHMRHILGSRAFDGVIAASTSAAMAAVAAAESEGLMLRRDLDLATKEAIPFLHRFRSPIITVAEDVSAAGAFLAQAVMHRIAEPHGTSMQRLDEPAEISA